MRNTFLLLLLSLAAFTACNNGPEVTVCIDAMPSPVPSGAPLPSIAAVHADCSDPNGHESTLAWWQMHKRVSLSPEDAANVLKYCKKPPPGVSKGYEMLQQFLAEQAAEKVSQDAALQYYWR